MNIHAVGGFRYGWMFIGPFWLSWGPQGLRLRWGIRVGRK